MIFDCKVRTMLYHIVVQDKKIFQKHLHLGASALILQQGITFKKHKKVPKYLELIERFPIFAP